MALPTVDGLTFRPCITEKGPNACGQETGSCKDLHFGRIFSELCHGVAGCRVGLIGNVTKLIIDFFHVLHKKSPDGFVLRLTSSQEDGNGPKETVPIPSDVHCC